MSPRCHPAMRDTAPVTCATSLSPCCGGTQHPCHLTMKDTAPLTPVSPCHPAVVGQVTMEGHSTCVTSLSPHHGSTWHLCHLLVTLLWWDMSPWWDTAPVSPRHPACRHMAPVSPPCHPAVEGHGTYVTHVTSSSPCHSGTCHHGWTQHPATFLSPCHGGTWHLSPLCPPPVPMSPTSWQMELMSAPEILSGRATSGWG